MIDFLRNIDISTETIDKIEKQNNDSILYDLSCNEEDCIKIINYFKNLGINNIDELLIYEIDIFKLSFEDIVKKFSNFNIPAFVKIINDDFVSIKHIYDVD